MELQVIQVLLRTSLTSITHGFEIEMPFDFLDCAYPIATYARFFKMIAIANPEAEKNATTSALAYGLDMRDYYQLRANS